MRHGKLVESGHENKLGRRLRKEGAAMIPTTDPPSPARPSAPSPSPASPPPPHASNNPPPTTPPTSTPGNDSHSSHPLSTTHPRLPPCAPSTRGRRGVRLKTIIPAGADRMPSPRRPRKDSSLPVRLDAATKQRLAAAAESAGLTTSALVRILIDTFLRSPSPLSFAPPAGVRSGRGRIKAPTNTHGR